MNKVTSIEGGKGFQKREDRLLELEAEIEKWRQKFFTLHIDALETNPDESQEIRQDAKDMRAYFKKLCDERDSLRRS